MSRTREEWLEIVKRDYHHLGEEMHEHLVDHLLATHPDHKITLMEPEPDRQSTWLKKIFYAIIWLIVATLLTPHLHCQTTTVVGAKKGTTNPAGVTATPAGADHTGLDIVCVSGCAGSSGATTPSNAFANPTTAGMAMSFNAMWNGTSWDLVKGDTTNGLWVNCKTGCAGGSSTPSDAFANPSATAGLTMGFTMLWNGSTWDRVKGDTTNGLWVNCKNGCAGGSSTPSDAFANPTTAGLSQGFTMMWNGTTWDRVKGDTTSGLWVNLKNASIAVTAASLPLPSNAAQETGGNLAAIKADVDKIPAQGQALAAASTPVVLPAAQITTLTPPAAITNFANETGGNLAAIKADVDKIPALGQALAAASVPVVLTAAQLSTLTPFSTVTANISGSISNTSFASTVADGANVTLGAKADAKSTATDTTAVTVMSVLKEISAMEQVPASRAVTNQGLTDIDAAIAAVGAAAPADALQGGFLGSGATGGFLKGAAVGDTYKNINISTATTTLLVTGVSGRQVRISSIHMVTAGANNVALIEGTGATCGTGSAGMAGGTTAASGYNFAANGGMTLGSGLGTVMQTATTGDSVCAVTSAATQLSGGLQYTIY